MPILWTYEQSSYCMILWVIVDKAFMFDLIDLLDIGVIILNEWVIRAYNNVIRSVLSLNIYFESHNVMETTIPQITTLTKSDLVKALESDKINKIIIGDVHTFDNKTIRGDIETLQSITVKITSDHVVKRYNTMAGFYQNDLALMTQYAKQQNADFNLFSISAHYWDKKNILSISFMRTVKNE